MFCLAKSLRNSCRLILPLVFFAQASLASAVDSFTIKMDHSDSLQALSGSETGANVFSKKTYNYTDSDGKIQHFPIAGQLTIANTQTKESQTLDAGMGTTMYGTTYGGQFKLINFELSYRQDRESVFKIPKKATFAYRFQEKLAPLMFVIPGLGGVSQGGMPQALAHLFFKLGYHVVIVDNTLTPNFALQVSRDGLVGYIPRDSEDMYDYMAEILRQLRTQPLFVANSWSKLSTVAVSSASVMGYSLGGLIAAHLSKVDSDKKLINFKKVGVFNPPIDMQKSISLLDTYNQPLPLISSEYSGLPTTERENLLIRLGVAFSNGFGNYALTADNSLNFISLRDDMISSFARPGATALENVARFVAYSRFAIGAAFSLTLGQVSLVANHLKGLKMPGLEDVAKKMAGKDISQRFLSMDGIDISYAKYVDEYLVPNLQSETQLTKAQMMEKASLTSLAAHLSSDERVVLFHNADDFLIDGVADLNFLAQTFRSRAHLFAHGGHCGNYWFPLNLQLITKALTP